MSDQRLDVFPSSMVKAQLKDRIKAARTGHGLLKRKSDAIKMRLHDVLSKIKQVKLDVGAGMIEAAQAHDDAVWAAGDFNHTVIEGVTDASFRIKADLINVAGVRIPKFERALDEMGGQANATTMVGFSRGGEQVQACKNAYSNVLDSLVQLAVLQSSLQALDGALKVTNRRVNALEYLVIPQLEITLVYVEAELFESEREDAYRVKKVKDVRQAEADEQDRLDEMARDKHVRDFEAKKLAMAAEPEKKQKGKKSAPEALSPAMEQVSGAIDRIMADDAAQDAAIADLF